MDLARRPEQTKGQAGTVYEARTGSAGTCPGPWPSSGGGLDGGHSTAHPPAASPSLFAGGLSRADRAVSGGDRAELDGAGPCSQCQPLPPPAVALGAIRPQRGPSFSPSYHRRGHGTPGGDPDASGGHAGRDSRGNKAAINYGKGVSSSEAAHGKRSFGQVLRRTLRSQRLVGSAQTHEPPACLRLEAPSSQKRVGFPRRSKRSHGVDNRLNLPPLGAFLTCHLAHSHAFTLLAMQCTIASGVRTPR